MARNANNGYQQNSGYAPQAGVYQQQSAYPNQNGSYQQGYNGAPTPQQNGAYPQAYNAAPAPQQNGAYPPACNSAPAPQQSGGYQNNTPTQQNQGGVKTPKMGFAFIQEVDANNSKYWNGLFAALSGTVSNATLKVNPNSGKQYVSVKMSVYMSSALIQKYFNRNQDGGFCDVQFSLNSYSADNFLANPPLQGQHCVVLLTNIKATDFTRSNGEQAWAINGFANNFQVIDASTVDRKGNTRNPISIYDNTQNNQGQAPQNGGYRQPNDAYAPATNQGGYQQNGYAPQNGGFQSNGYQSNGYQQSYNGGGVNMNNNFEVIDDTDEGNLPF